MHPGRSGEQAKIVFSHFLDDYQEPVQGIIPLFLLVLKILFKSGWREVIRLPAYTLLPIRFVFG
jgi:hypothetical protein